MAIGLQADSNAARLSGAPSLGLGLAAAVQGVCEDFAPQDMVIGGYCWIIDRIVGVSSACLMWFADKGLIDMWGTFFWFKRLVEIGEICLTRPQNLVIVSACYRKLGTEPTDESKCLRCGAN